MGDPQEIFLSGFLTIPLDSYPGDLAPQLSKEDLEWLISMLYDFRLETPLSDLVKSNFAYWLTYALQSTLHLSDEAGAQQICSLLYKLYDDDNPEILLSILAQTLGGEFAGQTVAYAWVDNLFSGTYYPRNSSVVVAISYIFTQLLEKSGDAFSSVVAKNLEEGKEKGKNAFLVLARALANATSIPNNQSTAELIAELLSNFVKKSPSILSAALTQEIIYGSFKGKSTIYVLAGAIKSAAEDNPKVVQILSRILIDVNKMFPSALVNSLCKTHEVGPYKGKNVLHIILTSLVSAAYINQNSEAVSALIKAIHQIWAHNSDGKINLALMQPIKEGEHADLNGIMMIVRALIAAVDHQLKTSAITDFLINFIKSDPTELGSAFTHHVPKSTVADYTFSPLILLIKALKNDEFSSLHTTLRVIIRKLASSKSAVDMVFSLAGESKSVFVKEVGIVHSLAESDMKLLIETENKEACPVSLDSRFFLTQSNGSRGPYFFPRGCCVAQEMEMKKERDEQKGACCPCI